VVLTSANVVDGVVIPVVTAMPTTNGIDEVVVCDPSFKTHVESAVAISDHVEVASDELIVVPVVGAGAKVLLVKVKVPLEKATLYPPLKEQDALQRTIWHTVFNVPRKPRSRK
jgi:hypothetical protein